MTRNAKLGSSSTLNALLNTKLHSPVVAAKHSTNGVILETVKAHYDHEAQNHAASYVICQNDAQTKFSEDMNLCEKNFQESLHQSTANTTAIAINLNTCRQQAETALNTANTNCTSTLESGLAGVDATVDATLVQIIE